MPTLTAILHVCSGSLAATRKGHSRARHFWRYLHFHGTNFLRLRRAVAGTLSPRIPSSGRWAVQQHRCKRALIRACSHRTLCVAQGHHPPRHLCVRQLAALAARVRSIARDVERRAALTVAALAAICSAFRRLVCRCTVHCWALCMDCARHTFACGCALCGGWC